MDDMSAAESLAALSFRDDLLRKKSSLFYWNVPLLAPTSNMVRACHAAAAASHMGGTIAWGAPLVAAAVDGQFCS